jgi:signal peptidase I
MKPTVGTVPKSPRYHGLQKLFLAGSVVATAAWWIRDRPFRVVVRGLSMAPALEPGDFLIALRNGTVRVGSLVVVEHPDRPEYEMVKRVGAVRGARVGQRVLPEGEYWVIGDNPAESTDSRSFGPVTRRAVKGVVRARYWPISRVAWFD